MFAILYKEKDMQAIVEEKKRKNISRRLKKHENMLKSLILLLQIKKKNGNPYR